MEQLPRQCTTECLASCKVLSQLAAAAGIQKESELPEIQSLVNTAAASLGVPAECRTGGPRPSKDGKSQVCGLEYSDGLPKVVTAVAALAEAGEIEIRPRRRPQRFTRLHAALAGILVRR